MPELESFLHLPSVLADEDIEFLKRACKSHLSREGIPCYVLLDALKAPAFLKIKELLEKETNESLYYLNDFYMYTDGSFGTSWHMDTELFTFKSALNVWILLSPTTVKKPLSIMAGINDSPERYYHDVKINEGLCEFGNLCTGESTEVPLATIEAERIHTPEVSVGDLLVFNPRRYHKTNVDVPKHNFTIKFVFGTGSSVISDSQVPGMFWPEVDMYNELVKGNESWDDVLDGIRSLIQTEKGRDALSRGFYPKKFDFYRSKIESL